MTTVQIEKNNVADGFLATLGTDKLSLVRVVCDALSGAEDGELFLEKSETETLVLSDGRIESSSYHNDEGFGLRRVEGKQMGYVSDNTLSLDAITQAGEDLRVIFESGKTFAVSENVQNEPLYFQGRPVEVLMEKKIALLFEIDSHIRKSDTRVTSVSVSLVSHLKEVLIVRPDGLFVHEFRPMTRMNMSVGLSDGERSGTGSQGFGGRSDYSRMFDSNEPKIFADQAIHDAQSMLEAEACPAGQMDVVLGSGWPGVLLHEAFGHLCEGDFNHKGTGAFSDKLGKQVAARGVTVVDEGNILDKRGSLSFDDEGTPTQRTVLVEDGILLSYMHDRMSARIFGVKPTGNGRRESYAHLPMPRMTNTHMLAGAHTRDEIIGATKNGIYIETMGGGQVEVTSGKFVFVAGVAWRIKDGKITVPLKGATLIGSGPKALLHVDMIGNDPALDNGVGMCGKDGQSVPVGVGQPTIRIRCGGMTVGGTEIQ